MKDSLTFTLIVNVLTLFLSAIVQRVLSASVTVDNEVISSIGKGILVLAAVAPGDTEKDAEGLANKVLKLKMWDDEAGGRWKKTVQDIDGEVLCVSQFTLFAKIVKNRPDFRLSAPAEEAKKLYHYFLQKVQDSYAVDKVKDGRFQAMMAVSSTNDGPVCAPLNLSQAFGLVR
ncbi:LOW QUALITY PROTEIN: D-tyrosyl-tRNA deacylase [Colletotrichum tofieldiae]|nr:LOW QUALITY PROTEIN: D-tyrosyl-tRNA deacylase [Colletotrichum tofieldiae]